MILTKERVAGIANGEKCYTHDDVAALARIALASLEAEPVGEVVLGEYDDCGCHPDARVVCIAADGQADWENFKDGTRLYTAPPAPVVPDLKPIGFLFSSEDGGVTYSPSSWPIEGFNLIGQIYGDVNACRAAMLQGAAGNSSAIPDGWVACSERLPDKQHPDIWLFDGKDVHHGYVWDGIQFVDWSEEYISLDGVTHWKPMTLPAAPEQEAK